MGTIVPLPQRRRKRAAAATPATKATILLFMGVRYVREDGDAAADNVAGEAVPHRSLDCAPLEIA